MHKCSSTAEAPELHTMIQSFHLSHAPPSLIPSPTPSLQTLHLRRNIRELALLQLRLPKDRVHIIEPVLDPSVLLDMIQVYETAGVGVAVHGGEDGAAAQLERFLVRQVVAVLCVEDAVGEGLAGADAEEVAAEAGAVAVDVVEGGAFLGGDAGAHGALLSCQCSCLMGLW